MRLWGHVTTNTNPQWLLNWAIAYMTPYLVDYGAGYANLQSKIFFVWFGACFICIAFVCTCNPFTILVLGGRGS